MKAKYLKRLAEISALVTLDAAPNGLRLEPFYGQDEQSGDVDLLIGRYYGSYHACEISVPSSGDLEKPVTINAVKLKELAALYEDDAEVSLTINKAANGITLEANKRKTTLLFDTREPIDPITLAFDHVSVEVDRAAFTTEATIALGCCATTMTAPILTGVRIVASKKSQKVAFQAADAACMLYQSTMTAKVHEDFICVLPARDFTTALKLLTGDGLLLLGMMATGKTLLMTSDDARIRVPIIAGHWPSFSQITSIEPDESVEMPVLSLKALSLAVKAYDAAPEAVLRSWNKSVALESRPSEQGMFQEMVEGTISRKYILPIAGLERAQSLSDSGAPVALALAPTMALVQSGDRKLYINGKVE